MTIRSTNKHCKYIYSIIIKINVMFNREQPQRNDENPNDASLDRHLKQENIINCFDDLHELSIVNEEKENSF